MASEARIGIRSDSKQAEGDIKGIRGLLQDLGKEAKTSILTGVGLAGGVAAFSLLRNAASAAVDYVGDAIQAASSLSESQNKVAVVFGDSAQQIEDWASTSATALGQSSQQALEAAGTYGNLFQAFGLGREESAKMSVSLVELAADLASFNNTPVDDALVALRSGLSGETEPLKRFGIALNDARMRAVLAAQGVTDLGATLTAAQKATAAYTIIMQDSALAQGDFERTSDGLANQQRILEAELKNLSAEIGTQLLPIMVELAHVATESLIPALKDLFAIITSIPWGDVATGIGALVNAFNPASAALEHFSDEAEKVAAVSEASGRTTASNWTAMGRAIQEAVKPVPDEVQDAHDEAVRIAGLIPGDIAKAIISGQKDVQSGVELLTELMNDEWTDASREAYYAGILTSQQLADGLASADADVRAQAILVRDNALRELERLQSGAYDAGADAGLGFGSGLGSPGAYGTVQNAAGALRNAAANPLDFKGQAYGMGQNVGGYYGQGLASTYAYVFNVAQQLKQAVTHHLEFAGSPPYTESKKIGAMVAKTWGEGLSTGLERLPDISGMLGGGRTSGFTSGLAPAAAMGAPIEIHTHLSIDGREITEIVDRQHYYMAPTTALYPKG